MALSLLDLVTELLDAVLFVKDLLILHFDIEIVGFTHLAKSFLALALNLPNAVDGFHLGLLKLCDLVALAFELLLEDDVLVLDFTGLSALQLWQVVTCLDTHFLHIGFDRLILLSEVFVALHLLAQQQVLLLQQLNIALQLLLSDLAIL